MCRCINFWRNRDGIFFRNSLQFAYVLFCVVAILSCQSFGLFTIEAECFIFVHPIRAFSSIDGVIVQMKMKIIHLIPCHELYVVLQEPEGEELAPDVKHEAALSILRIVSGSAFRNVVSLRIREKILQGVPLPVETPLPVLAPIPPQPPSSD